MDECAVVITRLYSFDFNDVDSLLIIGERFPEVHWLLFSDDLTESFLKSVVYNSRNMSVVFKDSSLKEITEALGFMPRGWEYICQRVTRNITLGTTEKEEKPSKLTHTEIEIVGLSLRVKRPKRDSSGTFLQYSHNQHTKNIFRKLVSTCPWSSEVCCTVGTYRHIRILYLMCLLIYILLPAGCHPEYLGLIFKSNT